MAVTRNFFRLGIACLVVVTLSGACAQDTPISNTPAVSSGTAPPTSANNSSVQQSEAVLDPLLPLPTPNPSTTPWVNRRVDAIAILYNLTGPGVALLRSLDVRQMRGDPEFFGSYGYKSWAGVGEAKPIVVMHELGHSYWGGFPIDGHPDLDWEVRPGEELSPGLQRYHADVLQFMAQPPDDYEILRQRLRNLPNLSNDNLEPLLHQMEADLVYSTGGDLTLVPPIFRKYWGRFLRPGAFKSWYEAVGWYRSLSAEDRAVANRYLGFEHLDIRRYPVLPVPDIDRVLITQREELLIGEERQRLYDFADQFDLLLGDSPEEINFTFWRGYLRDKLELHQGQPQYLAELDLPRATEIASALDFLTQTSDLAPEALSRGIVDHLAGEPFLVNFLPVLDNRTLLALFGGEVSFPDGTTLQATASFVQRLEIFSVVVRQALRESRTSPAHGAAVLQQFLDDSDFGPPDDLKLFFDLFRDSDPTEARLIAVHLDQDTVRKLLGVVPVQIRNLMSPEELLEKLDVTVSASVDDLAAGITLLVNEPSGNFNIDEPFLDRMYEVVATRGESSPGEMLSAIQASPFPLERFILNHPQAAAIILSNDRDATAQMVRESDPVLFPPARVIYRLIYANPELAADIILKFDAAGETRIVTESLAYFAYDQDRADRLSDLPISLEADGKFLETLWQQRGGDWLEVRLNAVVAEYSVRQALGEISPNFLARYRETLDAAVATLRNRNNRKELLAIVDRAVPASPK